MDQLRSILKGCTEGWDGRRRDAGSRWELHRRRFSHHFERMANVVAEGKMILSKQRKLGKESNGRLTGLTVSLESENSASILPTAFPPKCHHTFLHPVPSAQKDFSKSCCMLTTIQWLSETRCLERCLRERYCTLPWPSSSVQDTWGTPPYQGGPGTFLLQRCGWLCREKAVWQGGFSSFLHTAF